MIFKERRIVRKKCWVEKEDIQCEWGEGQNKISEILIFTTELFRDSCFLDQEKESLSSQEENMLKTSAKPSE